jgi:SpoVK/Ycf46/Vps4 family AAA+-type ATPase
MSDELPSIDGEGTLTLLAEIVSRGGAEADRVRVHLAKLLAGALRFDEALSHCRVLLERDPGDVDALEIASRALRSRGDTSRADRYLEVADTLASAAAAAERANAAFDTENSHVSAANVVPLRLVRGAPHRERSPDDVVEVEREIVTLADVAGMDAVKRRLQLSFLGPLRNPALRALYGKSLSGGLLLWGPPGCGKTYLARAIAGELGAKFINVGLEDVLDVFANASERNLHAMFETARRQAPCVLFFDEIDALGHKRTNLRGSGNRNVVVQLLNELDGVASSNEGVFVLGATNHPWDVDTALRRPGRLGRMLLVLPPDQAAREAILQMNLVGRPVTGLDLTTIARLTQGFSGADLVQICETATELALEDSIQSDTTRPIRQDDLVAALREAKESTNGWLSMARNYAEFANEGGIYDDLLDYMRLRDREPKNKPR